MNIKLVDIPESDLIVAIDRARNFNKTFPLDNSRVGYGRTGSPVDMIIHRTPNGMVVVRGCGE